MGRDSAKLETAVEMKRAHTFVCTHPATPPASHLRMMREVLRELETRGPIVSAPKPPAIFLLDWDDTCLCTSALEAAGAMADLDAPLAPVLVAALRMLETRVLSLLKTAFALGSLLIVTNAGDGWVELSASRFMPAVRAFLDAHWRSVKIISARAKYAELYPTAPLQWKARTFADELADVHLQAQACGTPTSIIVLGDSVGDQYAAHAAVNAVLRGICLSAASSPVSSPPPSPTQSESQTHNSELQSSSEQGFHSKAACHTLAQCSTDSSKNMEELFAVAQQSVWLKVVKFLERPSAEQLAKELGVLLDHISAMAYHPASFDVSMYNENENSATTSTSQSPGEETSTAHVTAAESADYSCPIAAVAKEDEQMAVASHSLSSASGQMQHGSYEQYDYSPSRSIDSQNEAVVAMEVTC